MADRGIVSRPSAGWYLFNWLIHSSAQKNAQRLQQDTIAQQAKYEGSLRENELLSQEKLIEKQAAAQERLYRLKIRSENPELYKELLAEDDQRQQLEYQRQLQAE